MDAIETIRGSRRGRHCDQTSSKTLSVDSRPKSARGPHLQTHTTRRTCT
jgi:hypothetical protein